MSQPDIVLGGERVQSEELLRTSLDHSGPGELPGSAAGAPVSGQTLSADAAPSAKGECLPVAAPSAPGAIRLLFCLPGIRVPRLLSLGPVVQPEDAALVSGSAGVHPAAWRVRHCLSWIVLCGQSVGEQRAESLGVQHQPGHLPLDNHPILRAGLRFPWGVGAALLEAIGLLCLQRASLESELPAEGVQ